MKKRLVTRSDFDGLVCAMLLKELDMIGDIKFVHPKDVQDGKVDMRMSVDLGLTVDERIADGYYYSKTVRLLRKLLDQPELLDRPLGEPSGFQYE